MSAGEVKLLTEAEAHWVANYSKPSEAMELLRERGLIAPEPEPTDEDHAWKVCVEHGYSFRGTREHNLATAALRRGMELRPPLTREMVREAVKSALRSCTRMLAASDFDSVALDDDKRNITAFVTRLHAALTDAKGGE